eukprot:3925921-Pyramimonas_sp.AAC.1
MQPSRVYSHDEPIRRPVEPSAPVRGPPLEVVPSDGPRHVRAVTVIVPPPPAPAVQHHLAVRRPRLRHIRVPKVAAVHVHARVAAPHDLRGHTRR